MRIKEYRIVLPMTVEEFQIGQRYSVAESSRQETGGGEGVQVLRNEPFEGLNLFHGQFSTGQYTHKIYHLNTKIPSIVRPFLPSGSKTLHEHSWNAYPYCKTELTNPDYMGDNFFICIETLHLADRGNTDNALRLAENERNRKVIRIDIANDKEHLSSADIRDDTRPSTYRSEKTQRGPLLEKWQDRCEPVMCAYKLVTINFKWFGLQKIVESFAHKQYPRLFCKFHREVFCWMDRWHHLTLEQIRAMEEDTKKELDEIRSEGEARGMTA